MLHVNKDSDEDVITFMTILCDGSAAVEQAAQRPCCAGLYGEVIPL